MRDNTANYYMEGKPTRTATVNGREYLFFSGYNYLGINADLEFSELVAEGMSRYGWLFPSSRISNTRLALFEECEALLADITGCEAAVLLPSGFAAGRVATSYHNHEVYNAPGSHPAILQFKAKQQNMEEWSGWMLEQTQVAPGSSPFIIASDTVNPLTAELHDFNFLKHAKSEMVAILDDSHGIGVIGNSGAGVGGLIPRKQEIEYLLTYSLSKAFGISGGAISCSAKRAQMFKTVPEYAAVTPLSPAQVYAFVNGQHIYRRQWHRLMENAAYFAELIKDIPGIEFTTGFPVFILPSHLDEKVLLEQGILISSFPYPDPAGATLKRIVLNALHTQSDLEILSQVLHAACQQPETSEPIL